MRSATPTDAELAVVARVAGREAWSDLAAPPERHGPRTLEEELAVDRFRAAVPSRRRPRSTLMRARLALIVCAVLVLGVCWLVSPTRTAIGLFAAALVSFVASHRRRAVARPTARMGVRRRG